MFGIDARRLCVVGLVVCVVALAAEGGLYSKKKREDKTAEEIQRDAQVAYKELFVWKDKLKPKDVLEKLALIADFGPERETDIDYRLLQRFNEPTEANCDDTQYVRSLKRSYERVKSQIPALKAYMSDCLKRQLQLCDYPARFRRAFEAFKSGSGGRWDQMEEINKRASDHGKRHSKWHDGDYTLNPYQYNGAINDMARDRWADSGHDQYVNTYKLISKARGDCADFVSQLEAALEMTSIDPKWKKDREVKEWHKYMSTCKQMMQTNYQQTLDPMIGQAYMPEFDNWYNQYQEYTRNW